MMPMDDVARARQYNELDLLGAAVDRLQTQITGARNVLISNVPIGTAVLFDQIDHIRGMVENIASAKQKDAQHAEDSAHLVGAE